MESLRVMSSEHKPARELDVRKLGDLIIMTHGVPSKGDRAATHIIH